MKNVVDAVAQEFNLTKKLAKEVVETVLDEVRKEVLQEGKVKIGSLGTLVIKEKKARTARNPKTGEPVQVPAKRVVAYKPTKELKSL